MLIVNEDQKASIKSRPSSSHWIQSSIADNANLVTVRLVTVRTSGNKAARHQQRLQLAFGLDNYWDDIRWGPAGARDDMAEARRDIRLGPPFRVN